MGRRLIVAAAVSVAGLGVIVAIRGTSIRVPPDGRSAARSLLLVTIDTLRADHVGAYGAAAARTPGLDGIARDGVRFERAFAPAPITLTSHASLLTGRYPPGHGARHNGMPMDAAVPTLATILRSTGFSTGAFIAAFPLDRRFGLARGFDVYSDRMPRGADGRPANERPGSVVVDEALVWLAAHRDDRFFLWVHLFEPHAPYGDPQRSPSLTPIQRYDQEIATADAQIGRLLDGLGPAAASTLVIAAGDHGEAFGEHGEIAHSVFVYDTTLRVPLLMAGAGITAPSSVVTDPVCLIDIAPTVLRILGQPRGDSDGLDLGPAIRGAALPARELYAESYAPLLDFGWSPLRALRSGRWKLIEAPRAELFDIERDPGEQNDHAVGERTALLAMSARLGRFGAPDLPRRAPALVAGDPEAAARLRALGYASGTLQTGAGAARPDPKDRRELAARIAQVTSGELRGPALQAALEGIIREDPGNLQAHVRLGDMLLNAGHAERAEPHFAAAVAAQMPTADAYLGLAACQVEKGVTDVAMRTLSQADLVEPDNPVVMANIGLLQAKAGQVDRAVSSLMAALAGDADLHEARFNLALILARAGRRAEAEAQARELLRRLPEGAPQRGEVGRLLGALK